MVSWRYFIHIHLLTYLLQGTLMSLFQFNVCQFKHAPLYRYLYFSAARSNTLQTWRSAADMPAAFVGVTTLWRQHRKWTRRRVACWETCRPTFPPAPLAGEGVDASGVHRQRRLANVTSVICRDVLRRKELETYSTLRGQRRCARVPLRIHWYQSRTWRYYVKPSVTVYNREWDACLD